MRCLALLLWVASSLPVLRAQKQNRMPDGTGWGMRFKDAPELNQYDVGINTDVSMYEAYQRRRVKDIAEYLTGIQEKLRARTLTVGFLSPTKKLRGELVPLSKAFAKLGAKVAMYSKYKLPEGWLTRDDILVTYAYQPGRFQPRLDIGKHTLVVELAFWRGKVGGKVHQSYTWDGVNNRGLHPIGPMKRWTELRHSVPVRPWQQECGKRTALILGQVMDDRTQIPTYRRYGSPNNFYQHVTNKLRDVSNLGVWFKAHPVEVDKTKGKYFRPKGAVDVSSKDLVALLNKAYMAVVANSGAGVMALTNGIPIYAADVGFIGWRCSLHSLEDVGSIPLYNRDTCLNRIAYSQWSDADVEKGTALHYLLSPQYYNVTQQLERPETHIIRSCPEVYKTARTANATEAVQDPKSAPPEPPN